MVLKHPARALHTGRGVPVEAFDAVDVPAGYADRLRNILDRDGVDVVFFVAQGGAGGVFVQVDEAGYTGQARIGVDTGCAAVYATGALCGVGGCVGSV